jgi:hypothetical protein
MKNSTMLLVGVFALVAAILLASSAFAGGGDPRPVLRAIPEQSTWVADGTTQYKITLVADSTPLGTQNIRGIQAGYNLPTIPGYQFNVVSVNTQPSNDFFAGYSTTPITSPGLVWRSVDSGNGPSARTGNFVELYVTVNQVIFGSNDGVQTSLQFDSDSEVTYFRRPIAQGGNIAPTLESVPFTVQPRFRVHSLSATAIICDDQTC